MEDYVGLEHLPLELHSHADANPKLLAETADKPDLQYFHAALYDIELLLLVGEFHVALSPEGDAWGMADFEGDGSTPVVWVSCDGIEDASNKIYDALGLGEIDPYELKEKQLDIAELMRAQSLLPKSP